MDIMIQVTFLVIAVLAVQKIFGQKLHVYVRYGLWGVVVLRLLIPVNIADSPFSTVSIADAMARQWGGSFHTKMLAVGQAVFGEQAVTVDVDGGGADVGVTGKNDETESERQSDNNGNDSGENYMADDGSGGAENIQGMYHNGTVETDEQLTGAYNGITEQDGGAIGRVFFFVRLIVSLFVGGFLLAAYFRFWRRLRRTREIYMGDLDINVRIRHRVPVYRVKKLKSPCLVGFLHPAVYVGKNVRTDSDRFRYIVTHEQVHYLHGDYIWAFLRAVLLTLYWYHPFVWIAAAVSAKDGEMACDYGTIRRLGEGERFSYSEMLLEMSCKNKGRRVYSYGTMLWTGKSEIKERILRLTNANTSRVSVSVMAGLLMVVMAGCAFTGNAAQAEENGKTILLTNPAGNDTDAAGFKEAAPPLDNSVVDDENMAEESVEARELEVRPAQISAETLLGVDGAVLDYASAMENGEASVVIFHDYFGLVVYDLTNNKVLRSLDLEPIGCNMTQGDDACQVAVSADGNTVWLHPMSKHYMYRYEVEENKLYEVALVKNFEIDLEVEELFDRFLTIEESLQKYVGWRSNYLYEEYKNGQGVQTANIYLYVSDEEEQKLGNMKCVWDDMVFMMFSGDEEAKGSASYTVPCVYSRISDVFGERMHPVTQEIRRHEGIDFAAQQGTEVIAAADGVVYDTGYSEEYGNYTVLLHPNGDMTYYCQCQSVSVQKDEHVKQGDVIGTVGSTGKSTGPHLHFAISQNGEFVDPEIYLPNLHEFTD